MKFIKPVEGFEEFIITHTFTAESNGVVSHFWVDPSELSFGERKGEEMLTPYEALDMMDKLRKEGFKSQGLES
jgi:hypothetical protein